RFHRIYALSLEVHHIPVENRVAVGVWRRPEDLTAGMVNVETDALVSVPGNTPGWSKAAGKNYRAFWRESVAPALWGGTKADDVRWDGLFQDLGPGGEPPGIVYPLHHS